MIYIYIYIHTTYTKQLASQDVKQNKWPNSSIKDVGAKHGENNMWIVIQWLKKLKQKIDQCEKWRNPMEIMLLPNIFGELCFHAILGASSFPYELCRYKECLKLYFYLITIL